MISNGSRNNDKVRDYHFIDDGIIRTGHFDGGFSQIRKCYTLQSIKKIELKLLKILRPTKALFFCIFFCYSSFALTTTASAQSPPDTAFYQLSDATGYAADLQSHQLANLHAAAISLREALPVDFQSDFAVYDLGFYHHHASYESGIPCAMQQAINGLTTPYYLVFGREMDNEGSLKKVWVEMELPEGGYLLCIKSTLPSVISDLFAKLRFDIDAARAEDPTLNGYVSNLGNNISKFGERLSYYEACCPIEDCDPCVFDDLNIFSLLLEKHFLLEPIRILNDPDWESPPIALISDYGSLRVSENLNVNIGFLEDEVELEIDSFVSSFLGDDSEWIYEKTGQAITHSVHVFKYPRDCNLFEHKWNEYLNDPSDHKVFFAVINIDNSAGVLGFTFESTSPASGLDLSQDESNKRIGFQGEYPIEDELIGIQEILDSANASCAEVLTASMAVAAFEREKLTPHYRNDPTYRKQIDNHLENWTRIQKDANYSLSIFLVRELEAVRKEMGYEDCKWWQLRFCSLRSRLQAEYNVCRQVIHTTLDICGLFFPICDLANMSLYLESGDLKNATFSALGAVPIAGQFAIGIKYGSRSFKYGNKAAILKFSVERSGHVHWVGGRDKLRNVIKRLGIQHTFDGIQLTYNSAIHNAHHLIPWSLVDKATTQHMYLMQRLARAGWHPSHPNRNGLIIPQKLPNGNTFHGSHQNYNNWVRKALDDIFEKSSSLTDLELLSEFEHLTTILNSEIQYAYVANKSIHQYFGALMPYKLLN